jgi:NADH dehydrogenase
MSRVNQTTVSGAEPVLITGANGQLGRRLIERFARCDPPVRARAVVRSQRAAASLDDLPESAGLERVVLDYRDEAALTGAARGCRHAVHLVGIIKEGSNSSYEDAHEASSRAIASAAAAAGLHRVVYLSILGANPASNNPCLGSKGRAEQILLESKTPALILRVPMVLGPGDTTSRIVRAEAQARLLPLMGGGSSRAQPIYADDVIEAIVAGTSRADLDDVSLDLAGPESLPQRELIERAASLYGRRPRVVAIPPRVLGWLAGLAERLMANPPFTRSSLEVIHEDDDVDPESARRRLGIELTPLDEILRRCVGPEAPR